MYLLKIIKTFSANNQIKMTISLAVIYTQIYQRLHVQILFESSLNYFKL